MPLVFAHRWFGSDHRAHFFVERDRPIDVGDAQHDMVEPLDPQDAPGGERDIIGHGVLLSYCCDGDRAARRSLR